MLALPPALAGLGNYRQFIVYIAVPSSTRPGKTDKFPIDPNTLQVPEKGIGVTSPEIWLDLATAVTYATKVMPQNDPNRIPGVGFVITEDCPYSVIDIDGCIGPDGFVTEPNALLVLQAFEGAGRETSRSGKGYHLFCRGVKPTAHAKRSAKASGIEFYTGGRFIALTGEQTHGSCDLDCTGQMAWLTQHYFPPVAGGEDGWWQSGPAADSGAPADDDVLIEMARARPRPQAAVAAFGGTPRPMPTFSDLFDAKVEVLAEAFPADGDGDFNHSGADFALAGELAYWTGRDCDRIERLMTRSKLARSKWSEREGYLRGTIGRAASARTSIFKRKDEPVAPPLPGPVLMPQPVNGEPGVVQAGEWRHPALWWGQGIGGPEVLYSELPTFFAGWRYVADQRIVVDPTGRVYSQSQFEDSMRGYGFVLNAIPASGKSSPVKDDPWKAGMVACRANGCAFETTFYDYSVPLLAERVDEAGRRSFNLAKLPIVPSAKGNVRPFLQHLRAMMGPGQAGRDRRRILLRWATQAVQRRGEMVGWCPVIQGGQGNGKTSLAYMISAAIGESVTHEFDPHGLARKGSIDFNAYMERSLLILVQEPSLGDARHVLEVLKPLVTDEFIRLRRMRTDEQRVRNHTNWLALTNHKDGIPISEGDRRYAPLFSMQQHPSDNDRDFGRGGASKFAAWSKTPSARSAVTHFLRSLHLVKVPKSDIDATWRVAPRTPDSDEAMGSSLGDLATVVREWIEEGAAGMRGGWVSSAVVAVLVPDLKTKRLPKVMAELGYMVHPGLRDGRTGDPSKVNADNGKKTRLYVQRGSPLAKLEGAAAIQRVYEAAQKLPPNPPPPPLTLPP